MKQLKLFLLCGLGLLFATCSSFGQGINTEKFTFEKETKYCTVNMSVELPVATDDDVCAKITRQLYSVLGRVFSHNGLADLSPYNGNEMNSRVVTDYYFRHFFIKLNNSSYETAKEYEDYQAEFSLRISKGYETPSCVVFNCYVYTWAGGVHGLETEDALTFSKKDGHIVDSFLDSARDLSSLQSMIRKGLCVFFETEPENLGEYIDVDVYDIPLPSTLYPSEEGIVFHYGAYEIAPHVYGDPCFTVPYDEITPFLSKEARELLTGGGSPWYVGAFSADDGSKLLITESRIYEWPAQGKGYILCDYSSDGVYWTSDGGMITASVGSIDPFSDAGQVELELTENKTIIDYDTVYKKNPNLLTSLKKEAKKLDQEKEQEERLAAQTYTEFVEANKWLLGVWLMPGMDEGYAQLIVSPQGLSYIDPSNDDGVWQLESRLEIDGKNGETIPYKADMSAKIIRMGGFFFVDKNSKTISFMSISDGVYLKKAGEKGDETNTSMQQYFRLAASRLLTESDLSGFNKSELRILRNSIYARHGYIFKSNDLKEYFSQFDWYMPTSSDVSSKLSTIEKKNVEFIKKHE